MARVQLQVPIKQPAPQPPAPVKTPISQQKMLTIAVVALVVIVLVVIVMLLKDRNHLQQQVNQLSTTQTNSGSDTQKYQAAVNKLVETPSGVTPTVKTPSADEIAQLSKNNVLYKDTKAGDVFLLYTNPDKSLYLVIYRPSTGKILLATQASQDTSTTTSPSTR